MISLTYEDLFQDKYIFESIGRGGYYADIYPELIKSRNRKATRYAKYILNLLQVVKKREKRKGNILFLEHKFVDIADFLNKDYNIYLLHDSINIYKEFEGKKYNQYFYREWLKNVDKSFTTHNMMYANKALKQAQSFLINNSIDILIIGNDKMFMERLMLAAAKNIGIPCVVIQHGIYTDEISFEKLKTADSADIFWVWSDYVKDCYLKRHINENKDVKVIGYPFKLLDRGPGDKRSVLFLGNNYQKGDYKQGIEFLKIAELVKRICDEMDIHFYYRPHPGEKIDSAYDKISDSINYNTSLLDDLDKASIVIGDISSAMVEAALCERNVIQVIWNDLSYKAANDPMYGFTIKVNNDSEEIRNAILNCEASQLKSQIDEYYMLKNNNIREDIYRYIECLLSNGTSII